MTPNQLLFAHRYAEAARAYQDHMLQHPNDNYYGGLGQTFLSLGRFSEAAAAFAKANKMANEALKGNFPCSNFLGAAFWLGGNKQGGMAEWKGAVDAIMNKTCLYGDAAGGATQGLLLWYAAVTLNKPQERTHALKYLEFKHAKNRNFVPWPGPVVLLVLKQKQFEDLLTEAAGSPDLSTCITVARTDLLKRRHLCQALFYGACRQRELGDEPACAKLMQACSELENPIIQAEWYVARGECSGQ